MSQMKTLLEKLAEPIADDLIKSKPGIKNRAGNDVQINYLEWHTVADILDREHPEWSVQIKEVGEIAGQVFVRLALTIAGIIRENVGFESSQTDSYGDPFSNAFAMALKRTAALFGIGRYLYTKPDITSAEGQKSESMKLPVKEKPASERQRTAILNLAGDPRLTIEEGHRLNLLLGQELTAKKSSEVLDYFFGCSEKRNGKWVKVSPGVLIGRQQREAA